MGLRFETYDESGKLMNSMGFMTDHEIMEEDALNWDFKAHTMGTDYIYIDGQYDNDDFISGFGHGRTPMIGRVGAKLGWQNVGIGHHNPTDSDTRIDIKVNEANIERMKILKELAKNKDSKDNIDENISLPYFGVMDRMAIIIPDKNRGLKGIVICRTNVIPGETIQDSIGDKNTIKQVYDSFDFTKHFTEEYIIEDRTSED